ncbi:MAG: HEPN domain-containing protein [Betaproteobacteria bacterium]|nr:MAG: HEPN domain-containing protein [Betaproteobacteria bacterium]
MIAALNSVAGPFGKAYGRCVSDLYYACFHLSSALLASHGIEVRSHEAVQKLLALHFVKPAALPQETIARLNELMDKRHVADYKPYIPIGLEDIVVLRPWISGFVRGVLALLDKRAPATEAASLLRLAQQFDALQLA